MIQDVVNSAAMGTLRGIIQDRYGLGLELKFVQMVDDHLIDSAEGTCVIGNKLLIPIKVADRFLATAVLESGNELKEDDKQTLGQLIRLFLEPELFSKYLENLTHNHQTLDSLSLSGPSNDDMAQIFKLENTELFIDRMAALDSNEMLSPYKKLNSNFYFFEGSNQKTLFRIACDIHEISGRWAFLNFKDIQSGIHTFDDLKSLGAMTIVVDQISNLSMHHQQLLMEIIQSPISTEEPLFLFQSLLTLDKLDQQNDLVPGLAQLLKSQRIEADRLPLEARLLKESLEIIIEI